MIRAPVLSEQLRDIQGVLNSGYGWLTESRFWLLTIRDGGEPQVRQWLSNFVRYSLITTAERVNSRKQAADSIGGAMAIAFSFSGLMKLGLAETDEHPFPTPFSSGMGSSLRQELLRDRPREQWRWADIDDSTDRQTVHILVAEWRLPNVETKLPTLDPEAFSAIRTIENRPDSFKNGKLYEPFGFRDGIAQPVIRGFREDGANSKRAQRDAGIFFEDRLVEPGEFVLGYRNGYDELTYCPDVKDWTRSGRATHRGGRFTLNGSYLAVRQIQQDVKAFKAFEKAAGSSPICEKMVGRTKQGLPLSWDKQKGAAVSDSEADAFRYRVEDANGFICPKGAHIRRVNPRDCLGVDVQSSIKSTKLHRLLRRGRPYLEAVKEGENREGLFFIACNADLERQFEFLYQRWLRNFRFEDLHHEDDPIVGSPAQPKMFTVPGLPSGDEVSLNAFTQTVGGGYFFLPGIRALEFIVEHG